MRKKPLLIAEIGHAWVPFGWKSIKKHVEMVKTAGWDIAKFQAYDTDKIKQPGDTNYDELKKAELTYYNLIEARGICDKIGIEFMASAFDLERLEWLERLGVKRHKVASRSIYDDNLIKAMIATGKPVIASLANWDWCPTPSKPEYDISYLYCVTRRQILREGMNQDAFLYFIKDICDGFSDHTIGNFYAKAAIAAGVKIIEKHITLDKNAAGWDQCAAADFKDMVEINEYREKK